MVVCAAPARIVRDDTPRWLGAAYSSELASSKARCDRVAGYAALGHTHAIIVRQELRRVDRLTLTRDGPGSGKVPTLLAVRRKEPVCNRPKAGLLCLHNPSERPPSRVSVRRHPLQSVGKNVGTPAAHFEEYVIAQ